ncbi:DUF3179 domain-containing protein [archaeon]|nr:DUF3179 domain-containing protein [archaeon]
MRELALLLAGLVFLFGCTSGTINNGSDSLSIGEIISKDQANKEDNVSPTDLTQRPEGSAPPGVLQYDDLSDNVIQVTNGIKHLVPLEDIHQGCFGGKDCIPSIDNPKFESAQKGAEWLNDKDVVLALDIGGTQKAYPQRIMNWHEIVNDEVNGTPIAVTFCPLCGSALAYERILNGETVEFGVSGKLYNSDLIMYDRSTETYWGQIDGIGIVGELTGVRLTRVPIQTIFWGDWVKKFPNTLVLSRDTGFVRDYGQYPYGSYEDDTSIYFPISGRDGRLHEKSVVHGIEINGSFKAYLEEAFEKGEIIQDELGGEKIEVESDSITGAIKVFIINDSGERTLEVVAIRNFWFAWFAFHPNTELYEG